jgi:hypothetical protein
MPIMDMDLVDKFKKLGHPGLARDYLKKLTVHHRVQGSIGLIEALKAVKEIIDEFGLETKMIEVPADSERGFMESPVSWDVKGGFLEFKRGNTLLARYDYNDHPTLIAAHSPKGEGCGTLKLCVSLDKCEGESVLVEAPAYIAYRELDADLLVLYDSNRYPEAVPYTGLFLRSIEVKKKPAVFNIPASIATKLISQIQKGLEIEVCWSSNTVYVERPHYMLLAHRGDSQGVLYISHICHPKPGGHDNASGSVANVLVAYILSQMREISHTHVWVPEYTGTIFLRGHLPGEPLGVINLDMVGSKQWITDSTLNIIISPLFIKQKISAYTFLASKAILDEAPSFGGFKLPRYRYSFSPYSAGSDHDVTIGWGLDSVMLNEWPSKYYHTDMDDIDSISPKNLTNIAIITSLAGVLTHKLHREDSVLEAFNSHLKSWYAIEALKYGIDISILSKVLENGLNPSSINKLITPLALKIFYKKFGRELYMKIRELKGAYSFFTLYAPLAYINNIQDPVTLFQVENLLAWNTEERKFIEDVWDKIREDILK